MDFPKSRIRFAPSDQLIRLVIGQATWEAALRSLGRDPSAWASGDIESHSSRESREFIVREMTVERFPPKGADRLPLSSWLSLRILPESGGFGEHRIFEFVDIVEPLANQLVVFLFLNSRRRDQWLGIVFRSGQWWLVDEVLIVGRGQLRLTRIRTEKTENDFIWQRRASRLIPVIGESTAQTIRRSTVTLVGAGRNGWKMAFELAGLGVVQRMRIVDLDLLEWENIDFMPGCPANAVGRSKAQSLAAALRRFRPELAISLVKQSVANQAARKMLLRRSDLIVSAVDNDLARLAVSLLAIESMTIHLDVATEVQRDEQGGLLIAGDARLLLPGQGCAACVGSMPNVDQLLNELDAPPGCLPLRRRPQWDAERLGSLGTINSITCAAAAQMWLDLIMGNKRTSYWQRFRWRPEGGLQSDSGEVQPESLCRFCNS